MRIQLPILLLLLFGITACQTGFQKPITEHFGAEPDSRGSSVTYGAAKRNFKVGQTTQADVLKLMGSPNNMTLAAEGNEIWVHDRIRTESASQTIEFMHDNGWLCDR